MPCGVRAGTWKRIGESKNKRETNNRRESGNRKERIDGKTKRSDDQKMLNRKDSRMNGLCDC